MIFTKNEHCVAKMVIPSIIYQGFLDPVNDFELEWLGPRPPFITLILQCMALWFNLLYSRSIDILVLVH